ncbi:MAG: NAD(P)/FAD-dependent oxidoreductase [Candidatus Aenigmarchaeota archaeon]|nr:NAD(P)/FAD-dependent oxidoreductase [Candidatus Aenigmarchaeota archaeon]
MIKDSYDVVVAGAGPGGSSVSKTLAELGFSVLMVEKRQEIGAPKRCGEGLTMNTVDIIGEIPQECIRQKIDGATLYAPNGNHVLVDLGAEGGYIVERKAFDKWLAVRASRAGATVVAHAEVTDVIKEGSQVTGVRILVGGGEEKTVRAKVVVAADGVESTVSRKAGLNTTNKLVNVDSGYQYEMSNLKLETSKRIILYFGNDIAPRGYLWIFPKGPDIANVGIGTAMSEKPAKWYLDKFIKDHPEIFGQSSIIEANSGGIPVGGFLENMVLDGFLVVGDAAHQVNPIHGGGMKEATIAGEMAAKVIAKAIEKGDVSASVLSEYNEMWWKERGSKLKKVEKLREVVEKLSDSDFNMISESLTSDVAIGLTRGGKMYSLAKILMKNPRLVKLARHLI